MNAILRVAHLHKAWRCGLLPGFLFWGAFLLVLEPDNVVRAIHAGYALSLNHEVLRILGAAFLGGAATPLVLYMTRRFPVAGGQRWRHASLHALTMAGLAFALIVASCFAAVWGFGHRLLPSVAYVMQELTSNWALLVFALTCLTAIAHAARAHSLPAQPQAPAVVEQPFSSVLVTSRGRREWIAIADVDWIESQGNYVMMHAGGRNHWVRQTLSRFEAQLDRERFVRIHRRTIVALDRISEILAEGNGDASVRMQDGRTLRASRQYRKLLRDRWLGFGKAANAVGARV